MTEFAKPHIADEVRLSKKDAARLMRFATYAAVMTAAVLALAKFAGWWVTGSVALLGSLLDSVLDAAASIINMFAVHHALKPRDVDHRFGHGKAEALAGLAQAVIIAASALYLAYESVSLLFSPRPVANSTIGLAVTILAIILTFGLVRFQKRVIEKSGSLAISADHLHYTGDLLMNSSVVLAIVMSGIVGWAWFDPLVGLGIAGYILHSAWQIIRQSFDELMDREFPDEKRNRVREVALAHPQVLSVHDLRTRSAGTHDFIQLHLELDPDISLTEAHRISDEVEQTLMNEFPRAEILIHQDPAGLEDVVALDRH